MDGDDEHGCVPEADVVVQDSADGWTYECSEGEAAGPQT